MRTISVIVLLMVTSLSTRVDAQTLNTQNMDSETQLACEAILCLASTVRPAECMTPISHYFSIIKVRFWDTLQARLDFLNLCPIGGASGMDGMKSALVRGAGRCDAASLNVANFVRQGREAVGYVSDDLPDYCAAYFGNQYVRADVPRYVGTIDRGGFWAETRDYDVARAAYTARWAQIDRERALSTGRGR